MHIYAHVLPYAHFREDKDRHNGCFQEAVGNCEAGPWAGGNLTPCIPFGYWIILDFAYFRCITYSKNNSLIFFKKREVKENPPCLS